MNFCVFFVCGALYILVCEQHELCVVSTGVSTMLHIDIDSV